MVKVAWKVINGYGPYAYLQESVKNDGKVTSKHIAYLGAAGKNGLIPGKNFNVPPSEDFDGARIMVPFVGEETVDALKPGPLAAIQSMKAQVETGAAKKDIVVPGKGKTASTKAAAVAPKKKDKAGSGKGKAGVAPNTGETATAGHQAQAVSPGQAAAPKASPAPKVPLADDGKPIVSAAHAKSLEKAAATGDPKALVAAMHEAAGKVKAIEEGAPGSLDVAPPAPEKGKSAKKGKGKVAPDNQASAPDTLDAQGVVKEKPTLYPKMIQWAHGKPLVAPDEVEKLEAAAATGDVGAVEQAMTKLVSPKNAAILNAAAFLSHQMADPQVQQVHKALYGPAKVAPNNQGPAAAPFVEDVSTPTPAAAPKLPPHLSSVLKIAQVMKLEELAAAGDPDELTAAAGEMADLTLDSKAYSATHSAKHYLLGHMQPLPETPSYTEAVVGGNQDDMSFLHKAQAALNSDNFLKMPGTGEPKMSEETTEKLLAAAVAAAAAKDPKILEAHGNALQYEFPEDDPEFSGIAVATDTLGKEVDKAIHGEQSIWWAAADAAQAPAPETSPAPGPAAGLAAGIGGGEQVAPNNQGAVVDQQAGVAAPAWKLMEGPKGSTPGGLYEDQQGNKAYIKVPQSQQHVRNELLAQDLYKLAGVDVLHWTLRILSGISEGICNTMVQSGGEFLYIGVGGR